MAARRVQSAPVVVRGDHEPTSVGGERPRVSSVAGFVSTSDVLAAVLTRLPPGGPPDAATLESAAAAVCASPLADLVPGGLAAARDAAAAGALRDWRLAGDRTTPLLDAIAFSFVPAPPPTPPPPPAHRLAVSDGGSPPCVVGVVSQSDVVAALASAPSSVRAALDATPLPPPTHPPVVVGANDYALTAFKALQSARVSGAAVIDAAGRVTASLSTSDFRVVGPGVFGSVLLPVADFLALRPLITTSAAHGAAASVDTAPPPADVAALRAHAAAAADAGAPAGQPVVTLGPGASLGDAVATLSKARVHRAWRIDDEGRPVGVVSCGDVLTAVLQLAGGRAE